MDTVEFDHQPFDPDAPAIGRLPASEAVLRLRSVGADELVADIEELIASADNELTADTVLASFPIFGRESGIWVGTQHAYGFIPAEAQASDGLVEILPASRLQADANLKGQPLKIALDYLRATDYPGRGVHQVLLEFKGKHQAAQKTEELQFSQAFRVEEAGAAGATGYPIFLGLTAGGNGVEFAIAVTNVSNDDDKQLLGLLESDALKSGLKLLNKAQPAIAPMTAMAVTIGKMFARRHENIRIHDVFVGLDFEPSPTSVRLALGSYVVVQLPARHTEFDWLDYVYSVDRQRYVRRDRPSQEIPYNFFVFRISAYQD